MTPVCECCDGYQCLVCGKAFDTDKQLAVHQITHHRRACGHCGEIHSKKGLDGHEQTCTENPFSDISRMFPAVAAQLIEFLSYAETVPQGSTLTVTRDQKPCFMSRSSALRLVAQTPEPVLIIPAEQVPTLLESARYRRVDDDERKSNTDPPEPDPLPATGGINWSEHM